MHRIVKLVVICAIMAVANLTAWAQESFPIKPITLVVPYATGGATDVIARVIGKNMSERLKQAVVIDNKPGAGTELGAAVVARAPADGYTLLISSNSTFTVNPALKQKLQYSPDKDFESIGLLGGSPLAILALPSFPASNVQQLLALAKSKPGKLSYASFGAGTTAHLAGEMLKLEAGIDLLHIPYKGSGLAMTDLLGGQVDLSFDTIPAALPMLRAGKIKVLATTGIKRSTVMPKIPTLAEQGFPKFEMAPWLAIVGPRGMPKPVSARLASTLADTLNDPAIKKQLEDAGLEVAYQAPSAYDARVSKELPKLREFVAKSGITLD